MGASAVEDAAGGGSATVLIVRKRDRKWGRADRSRSIPGGIWDVLLMSEPVPISPIGCKANSGAGGLRMQNEAERTSASGGSLAERAKPAGAGLACDDALWTGSNSGGEQLACPPIQGLVRKWTRDGLRLRFANLPIRCKIVLLIATIGAMGLVAESTVFVLYQRHTLQGEVAKEAGTLVQSLGAKVAPSVSAGDRKGAQAALAALSIEHQVTAATLYDRSGSGLAEYRRTDAAPAPLTAPADGERIGKQGLALSEEISLNGQRVGSMILVYDLTAAQARVRQHFRIGLWLMMLSFVVRVIVVIRLARGITDPLGYLAKVAQSISTGHDYSVRAERRTGGEIGVLIDAFNRMLAQIERHDQARRAAEMGLRESEERYAIAARGSNDGLWDWRMETGKIYFSARLNVILGEPEVERWGTAEELFGRIHPADRERVRAVFGEFRVSDHGAFEIECRIRHCDGRYLWVLVRGTGVRDEARRIVRAAGSMRDITRTKTTDPVTGLPNRLYFLDELERALENAKSDSGRLAVLFLDLDRFRMVIDSLGRTASEELLTQVAGRLRSTVRAAGREVVLARTGEDEFAMLLTGFERDQDAASVARETLEHMREPFYLEGQRLPVGASIGIAFGVAADEPKELLRNAETAMYYASTKGNREFAIFQPSMRERAVAQLEIVTGLRYAVEANQLRLHYQPLVSIRERRIIGFESLVRWQHPERGLLRPAEFISIAEGSDLILDLGEWVLREACRQMAEWQQRLAPDPPLTIGVNVSARQLNDPDFAQLVKRVLEETGMEARRLRLEITESSLATDSAPILETLRALGRMQVALVIDDFGTGYSSLSYLQRLPFNILKIDRSFIRELGAGDGSPEIVRTIIQLARSFKLKVVAEGVETADQLTRLTELGCDLIQGFYFGRPVNAEQTEALIRNRDRIHPAFPYGERDYFSGEGRDVDSTVATQAAWLADDSV